MSERAVTSSVAAWVSKLNETRKVFELGSEILHGIENVVKSKLGTLDEYNFDS